VAASPAVGESLGSRSRYRLIAQPFAARKPASWRRLSHVTELATTRDSMQDEGLDNRSRKTTFGRSGGNARRSRSRNAGGRQAGSTIPLESPIQPRGDRGNGERDSLRYRHAQALGGLLSDEPGEERFSCIKPAAFRSYAARMGTPEWQDELASVLDEPGPCLMCAETGSAAPAG
jgi:hypothetical protein